MRQLLFVVHCLLLLQITPTKADAVAEGEIEALYQRWRTAVESADIAGYVGVLHPDISRRPPGAPGLDGRHNYREFLGPVFETARYEIRIDRSPKVTLLGDSAIVEYDYTIRRVVDDSVEADLPEGALEGEATRSHYIDIVAKDDTGAWKIRLHSWSMTL